VLFRSVINDLYSRSAVVVVPSRCMENSPTTMLQAMLAARAVVVPDQPPLREWVSDGVTGKVFPTGDASSLVAVVNELLGDAKLRASLGQAGRDLVTQRHNPDVLVERIEEIYSRAMQCG